MDNNHGVQPLLDNLPKQMKGFDPGSDPGRAHPRHRLFGQKGFKMISLPPIAAAAAAARAALPHWHHGSGMAVLAAAARLKASFFRREVGAQAVGGASGAAAVGGLFRTFVVSLGSVPLCVV